MQTRNKTASQEYTSRLFGFIFGSEENKEWTLSLYNAINNSHYEDASMIEFTTLSDVIYVGMMNDTSFLISDILSVYEHQSTYNPNMPLRMLEYSGNIFSGYVTSKGYNKYGPTLIPLPIPKLVVFYNGTKETGEEVILKLSDSFNEKNRDNTDIEIKVRMININYGRNKKLLEACKPLGEYSWFIENIRSYQRTNDVDLMSAINISLTDMPDDYVIKPFLLKNKAEVESMLDTEYNEAEVMALFKADGAREGSEKCLIGQICKKLIKGKSPEIIADELEENLDTISKICDIAAPFAPEYNVEDIYFALHPDPYIKR